MPSTIANAVIEGIDTRGNRRVRWGPGPLRWTWLSASDSDGAVPGDKGTLVWENEQYVFKSTKEIT